MPSSYIQNSSRVCSTHYHYPCGLSFLINELLISWFQGATAFKTVHPADSLDWKMCCYSFASKFCFKTGMSCTKHVSQKHCWCWATQCKGSENTTPGNSEKKWETGCWLAMKTSAIRFCWDVPGRLHGNRRQLKPCCVFAEQGRAQRWWHRRCPSLGLRVPVPVCAPRPLPPRVQLLCLPLSECGGCPRAHAGRTLGTARGWAHGRGCARGHGRGSARPRPSRPSSAGSGAQPRRARGARDGHPLPAPTVTYVGGRCRRERCRPRGRTPARLRQGCRPGGGRPPFRCRKGEYLSETRAFIPLGRSGGGRGWGMGETGGTRCPGKGARSGPAMSPLGCRIRYPAAAAGRRESPPAAAASASPRRWQPDEPRRGAAAVLGWTRWGCQRQPSARKARAEAVPARRRATPLRRGWRRRGGGRERGGAAPRRPGRKGKRGTGKVRRGHGHAKGRVRGEALPPGPRVPEDVAVATQGAGRRRRGAWGAKAPLPRHGADGFRQRGCSSVRTANPTRALSC